MKGDTALKRPFITSRLPRIVSGCCFFGGGGLGGRIQQQKRLKAQKRENKHTLSTLAGFDLTAETATTATGTI